LVAEGFRAPTYEDAQLGHGQLAADLDRTQYAENVELAKHYFAGEQQGSGTHRNSEAQR
jgi:hypothetical protein